MDRWGERLWECPAVDTRSVLLHDGWEETVVPQWPSMTKLRSVSIHYAKQGKYHLVWSMSPRVATKSFYTGVDHALQVGGTPWDEVRPDSSYEYAEWFAKSTDEQVSTCRYFSVYEFSA